MHTQVAMERKMDWDKLRTFNAAAEAGSFTNAGALLKLSQSAISRQVTALEHDLKASLFHRHARGLQLTEPGRLLQGAVHDVIARMALAEAQLAELRDRPSGILRISVDAAFGAFWLASRLYEFHDLYPEIRLSLMLDGGSANLAMGEADVSIRLSAPEQSDLVQRCIFRSRSCIYAAREYVARHGAPASAGDLDRHRLVALAGAGGHEDSWSAWLLRLGAPEGKSRSPVSLLDDTAALFQAVSGGLGIGILPHFAVPESAGLVRILPDIDAPRIQGYFAYPPELRHSKRIAVLRDFLLCKITEARLNIDPFEGAAVSSPSLRFDGSSRLSAAAH
jgi:DNA-binding transcriptional LysR family regulator